MEIENLKKLEEKVYTLVKNLEIYKKENKKLKDELKDLKSENSMNSNEKEEIKKRVTTLIELIDSIENEN